MAQKREAGPQFMLGLIPLGQPRPDTGPVPLARQRPPTGAARKGQGPCGHQLRHLHPAPHDLLQDPTRNHLPHPPLDRAPAAPQLGGVDVGPIAGPRTPEWRPRLEGDRKRIRGAWKGAPAPRAGEGGGGGGAGGTGGRAGRCERGPGGARRVWGAPGSPTSCQRRHCRSHD